MRNSETLRDALFKNIEGLANGTVTPDVAKATAASAMAICKTVDLDLRAAEIFKGDEKMKSLELTGNGAVPAIESSALVGDAEMDDELTELILKGHKNGLDAAVIAKRLKIDVDKVQATILANHIEGELGA